MSNSLDIRDQLVRMFGDEAPAQPRNAAEYDALPTTMRDLIRANCPEFHQQMKGDPGLLPAAVSLRRERGELTGMDIEALANAHLDAEAHKLQQTVREASFKALEDRHSEWVQQQEERIQRQHEATEAARKESFLKAQASITPQLR